MAEHFSSWNLNESGTNAFHGQAFDTRPWLRPFGEAGLRMDEKGASVTLRAEADQVRLRGTQPRRSQFIHMGELDSLAKGALKETGMRP